MKGLSIALCVGVTLAMAGPVEAELGNERPAQVDSQHVERVRAALMAAFRLAQAKPQDLHAIAEALRPIVSDPDFGSLTENERHAAYLVEGEALFGNEDYAGAQQPLRLASEMPQAGEDDWDFRLKDSFRLQDWGDAARCATALAQNWPDKLGDYNDQALFHIVSELDKMPDQAAAEFEMLKAFHAVKWNPQDEFWSADSLWLALIRLHLERDEVPGAIVVAGDLRDPVSFIAMHSDKRFDPVTEADPQQFDVMRAYETALASTKVKAAAAPDKLEGANAVAELLLTMDRPEEAQQVVAAALQRYKSKPGAFADGDDKINWTEDIQSRILFALGRSNEALAAIADAAKRNEDGVANVSQRINLADEYVIYDRGADALKAVENVEAARPSPYGLMALADARACAYFLLGDSENLKKTLDYMKAHVADGMRPFLNTLVFMGDRDAIAAEIISELRNPMFRADMLSFLQDYAPKRHPSEREETMHATFLAVRGRPDVAAEIAEVGRIQSYPVQLAAY